MGKIKRERKKFHIVTEKKNDETNIEKKVNLVFKPKLNVMQNIFAGINIQLSDINKLCENPDSAVTKDEEHSDEHIAQTLIETKLKTTSKSTSSQNLDSKVLTKKEKLAMKRQRLLEKLDATQKIRNELQRKPQKPKRKFNCNEQVSLKSNDVLSPMLSPAATKSSDPNAKEKAVKNVFSVPSLNDGLPALNNVFASHKDIFSIQKKSSISKKKNFKKQFCKNFNYLKKSMAKMMK